MRRAGRRILDWALLGLVVTTTYCWTVRICDDLSRDEAVSHRRYASHPLRAVALYKEPNNHPLESLFKSLLAAIPGLDRPEFHRLPGFLLLAGFLAAAWRWRAFLLARGATFAATVVTLMLFLSRTVDDQVMELRGYFPSILLGLVWFLLLARWTRLLDRTDAAGGGAPAITKRQRFAFAGLSAALLFLLPSNLALLCILWPATAMAFGAESESRSRIGAIARETLRLGLLGGAIALVLYLPILTTMVLATGKPREIPAYPVDDVFLAIRDEAAFVLRHCQPAGMNGWLYGGAVAALLAGSILRRRRAPAVRTAWFLIVATLVVCVPIAACFGYPERVRSPFVVPVFAGLAFLVAAVTSAWSPRTQVLAALLAVACGYAALPATIGATRFDRRGSDMAAFLETVTRPAERRVLVMNDNAHTLQEHLDRAFGDDWTIDSLAEMRQALSGAVLPPGREVGALERWATDVLFDTRHRPRIAPDDVDVLVLIGEKEMPGGAVAWEDPALQALKRRLSKVARYRRDLRDVEVWEKP